MGYEVVYTRPVEHKHDLPAAAQFAVGTVIRCDCGQAFEAYEYSDFREHWVSWKRNPGWDEKPE